jgi:thiol-disulfide isomerase/thioredoxin
MGRKFAIFALVVISVGSCRNNTVEISGKIENPTSGEYIFLDELKSNDLITVDSIMISGDGVFKFKRVVKYPSFYLLKINQNNFLTMLLEPGERIKIHTLRDSLNFPAEITGSEGTELLVNYNRELAKAIVRLSSLSDIYDKNLGNPDLLSVIDSLDGLAQSYLNEINSFTKKFIDENITSLASLMALYQQVAPKVYVLDPARDLDYFKKVDSSLYSLYPEYDQVLILHDQIAQLSALNEERGPVSDNPDERMIAPEISLPSPEGNTIKLSSTRGSIVLLDFWASWCPPCREENPNLAYVYKQYRGKGFQIYQVSLDKSKDAWIKGIQEDQLEKWIHVSDVKYWNSVVVPLYNIESIPFNYLLDREGRIIASNLRGDALQRKLAELFK